MKLSELISELQAALNEHGDVEVFCQVPHYGFCIEMDLIEPSVYKRNEGVIVAS